MTRSLLLSLVSLAGVGACSAATHATPPSSAYVAALLVADAAPALSIAPAPPPSHLSQHSCSHRVQCTSALHVSADDAPSRNAVEVYPWADREIYPIYTAPEQLSDIVLQPGETLVSVAAGDTARWVIGDTTSGSGADRRAHVLVKPTAVGLRTNLVIATDRRAYHLVAESADRTATSSVSWTYPEDALLALRKAAAASKQVVASEVAVENLNFNYRIDGDRPSWRPVRAFDDGHQLFIEFPPSIGEGEAPPLFVQGEGGRTELVNYRIRGRYYVVDRLFQAGELRLGERHQQVVRIIREGRKSS